MTTDENTTKSTDILLIGPFGDRLSEMVHRLELKDRTVETHSTGLPEDLTTAILRSRLVLLVHAHQDEILPVARLLRVALLAVPIVCETSVFSSRTDWSESGIVFADYDHLDSACDQLLLSTEDQTAIVRKTLDFVRTLDLDAPYHLMLQSLATEPTAKMVLSKYFTKDDDPFGVDFHESMFNEAAVMLPESHNAVSPIPLKERNMMDYRLGRWFTIGMTLLFLYSFFRFR